MSGLATLADAGASLSDVMAAVTALEEDPAERRVWRVGVSANVTVDLLSTFLRRHALLQGATAAVQQGSYDAHAANVEAFLAAGVEHLVLVNCFDNLEPAFEARTETLDPALVAAQRDRVCAELALVLEAARPFKAVHLARFHRLTPTSPTAISRRLDATVAAFNSALERVAADFPNVELLALDDVAAHVGLANVCNRRFYLRFKAPYTAAFCDELARRLTLATRAGGAYLHKVLALDCDNTLWGGIVGEDGPDGIRLGPHEHPGNVFWAAQQAFLALQRTGVLLCLCTKNNPADVAEVLRGHPHQVLRDEHLILQKVNWGDKVDNLVQIAEELGVGLDSVVFLDDSPFEAEAVRERLPQVRTVAVPAAIGDYPRVVQEIAELFGAGSAETGGAEKTEQYRRRAQAGAEVARHATREEYLASLELRVRLRRDPRDVVARIAQLTQKSNQFNLTTRRYTEAEIGERVEDPGYAVYALEVADRFGDGGLTGVLVVRHAAGGDAEVEAFLMSCRVIGRDLERAPWPTVLADARAAGCEQLAAAWARSPKNAQVEDFFDRLGLHATERTEDERHYRSAVAELDLAVPPHIEVEVCRG